MACRAAEDWLSQTIFNVEAVMKRHGFVEDFPKPVAVPLVAARRPEVFIEKPAIRRGLLRPVQLMSRFSSWLAKHC